MKQSSVLQSLGRHMDALNVTVGWTFVLALAVGLEAISGADRLTILDSQIPRSHAHVVVGIIYILLNVKVLLILTRLGNLMLLLRDDFVLEGYSNVVLHTFIANPFGYFGTDGSLRLDSAMGLGSLVLFWWMINATLLMLGFGENQWLFYGIAASFFAIGAASTEKILEYYRIAANRLEWVDRKLYIQISVNEENRKFTLWTAIAIGAVFAMIMRDYVRP